MHTHTHTYTNTHISSEIMNTVLITGDIIIEFGIGIAERLRRTIDKLDEDIAGNGDRDSDGYDGDEVEKVWFGW